LLLKGSNLYVEGKGAGVNSECEESKFIENRTLLL
jgi:hypothetical protein